MELLERSFRAMSTGMRVLLYAASNIKARAEAALEAAELDIRAQETRFSRFLPDSELSPLNDSAGQGLTASLEMLEVLMFAREMNRETKGLFNPGILTALEWSGYDRSFETLPANRPARWTPLVSGPGIESMELRDSRVRLAAGCRLDLGGLVKGWTADRVANNLADLGPTLVDLGGDIAVRGQPPNGSWHIGVATPDGSGELLTMLEVRAGGIATSGLGRRTWRMGSATMHHIIDPRTGRPANSDIIQVVAQADSAARADVWAKTALILGVDGCEGMLQAVPNLELMVVHGGGAVTMTSGIRLHGSRAA